MMRAILPPLFGVMLLTTVCPIAAAQDSLRVTLLGQVFAEETGKPLAGAHVFIAETRYGSATDAYGTYRIDGVTLGLGDLIVSMPGYAPQTVTIDIADRQQCHRRKRRVKRRLANKSPGDRVLHASKQAATDKHGVLRDTIAGDIGNRGISKCVLRPECDLRELRIGTTDFIYRQVDQPDAPAPAASAPNSELKNVEPGIEVIEFIDEVVKVRTRELPGLAVSRRQSGMGRAGIADRGVLQFSKRQAKHSRLSDELGQLGGLPKFLLILAILIASVGIAWLAWRLATV